MLDEEKGHAGPYDAPLDVPDEHGPLDEAAPEPRSLTDDLAAIIEDGKTYFEAEVIYQKSRGAFVAGHAKRAVVLGLGAFGVFHLALIAATVGVIMALIPLVGGWAATGIVTVVLIIVGIALLRMLKRRFDEIAEAFSEQRR